MFTVGDVVQLKTGGPRMTVEHIWKNAHGIMTVRCTWFDKGGTEQKTGEFAAASVVAKEVQNAVS
jgi:uncharacterized protein YodC (DUF2158 family)